MKSVVITPKEKKEENSAATTAQKNSAETSASPGEKSTFTAIDMWHRNRTSRSASDRFRKWNLN